MSKDIPDSDDLYRKINQNQVDAQGRPDPSAFSFRGDGTVSVLWSKYIRVEEVLPLFSQTRRQTQDDADYDAARENGVAALRAGDVRSDGTLDVLHTPNEFHKAHSSITKTEKYNRTTVRGLLTRIAKVVVAVPPRN